MIGNNINIEDPWVFISYAKEDKNIALSLYRKLRTSNLRPWLDIHGLSPGVQWENVIPTIIRQSRFFIVLLSENAVGKRGFIQKEIRLALNEFEKMPVNSLFIIPVLINDCEVPIELAKYHWTNISERGFYKKLESTLIKSLGKFYIEPTKPKKKIKDKVKSSTLFLDKWSDFLSLSNEFVEGRYKGAPIICNLHIVELFTSSSIILSKLKKMASTNRKISEEAFNKIIPSNNEKLKVVSSNYLEKENIYQLATIDPLKFAHVNKNYYEYLLSRHFPCDVYLSETETKKTHISPIVFSKNGEFVGLIMPTLANVD